MVTSYLESSLSFKLKKVLRYISLYGISRTLVKIRGQLHMQRDLQMDGESWDNPSCRGVSDPHRFVAIVGCGNFAYSAIAYYLAKRSRKFLHTTLDSNTSRAISLCKDYGGIRATSDMRRILEDPSVRLVYIASNHASHAEYAIDCLEAGKHVHIEKPHVVTEDQLDRLLAAQSGHPDLQIHLGFNRPKSRHFEKINSALMSQSGPVMINWFIAGHEIADDHWYFKEEEGGRVLGNLCHWTDLTLEIVGVENAFPCEVVPASHPGTKSDYCAGIRFADGSVAGITFSAKGHTFEGVRELLQAHRGNVLVRLRDFEESIVENVDKRSRLKTFHRNHGHSENIVNSYDSARGDQPINATDPRYLRATSKLFLGVRQAFDQQAIVRITLD